MTEKMPELGGYPEGASEPLIQRFHKVELGSRGLDSELQERPPVTPEVREKMNKELLVLGKLMEDSGLWWQIDGSLNISLRRIAQGGDYIGTHADVDISVLRGELPRLQEYLKAHRYGLFLRRKDGKMRELRRIGFAHFDKRDKEGKGKRETPYIAAIDEGGKIRTDADLIRLEVSIIDIDAQGNPSERHVNYPKEWLQGETINFHGQSLNLSHPARFLLYKIWFTRGYDERDIELFGEMGVLTAKDLDAVERVIFDLAEKEEWWKNNSTFQKDADMIRGRLAKLRKLAS